MKLYLGESIRKFRSKNNITQEKLAAHLGVSYQAVSRWENETSYPDIELLPEIASFFGVTLEELLGIKDNAKKADDKSRELYNRVLDNCLPKGEIIKILDELRDLERKYPNNWEIKTRICEILLFYSNRSTDEILPEIRRYTKSAMEAFPEKEKRTVEWFYRYMIIAAPENEVDEWASLLPEFDLNLRNQVLTLRYQHLKNYEKAKEYGCLDILYNLRELTTFGLISDIDENPKDVLFPALLKVKLIDTMIGIPYYGEDGKVHNSIMLYERINPLFTEVIINIGKYYSSGTEEEIRNGFNAFEKAVNYSILYADAVKEEYFVSDNPYLTPQKIGNHKYMDVGEEYSLKEHSLDVAIAFISGLAFEEIKDDERYKYLCDRIFKKKSEIEEYWKNKTA